MFLNENPLGTADLDLEACVTRLETIEEASEKSVQFRSGHNAHVNRSVCVSDYQKEEYYIKVEIYKFI